MVDGISARVGDIKIPILGFGTAEDPFGSSPPEVVKEAILDAIKIGYRHFDTAAVYHSEKPLGEAISDALRLGLVKSRDELFITSKLWCTDAHQHLVLPALNKTLENLKLEYVDLYLIHWPLSAKPSGEHVFPFPEEDSLPLDMKSVWEAMEKCKEVGLTKSIGVSNFSIKKLQTLLATAKIPPAVNEIEMNPLWQQKKMRDFCKEKGMVIIAYSPLGAKGTRWGTPNVMGCQLLEDIAESKGKSIAQICVRWLHEQGVCLVVKSFNKERMKENVDIFGWQLSPEELSNISLLPQSRGCDAQGFLSRFGPFRTLQEFWDEE